MLFGTLSVLLTPNTNVLNWLRKTTRKNGKRTIYSLSGFSSLGRSVSAKSKVQQCIFCWKKKLYYIRDWPLSCQKLIDGLVTWRSPLYFGKKKKRVESSFATISNMAHHTALAPPLKVHKNVFLKLSFPYFLDDVENTLREHYFWWKKLFSIVKSGTRS